MKQLFTILFGLLISVLSFGQVNEKGKIHVECGVGAGIYDVSWSMEYQGEKETIGDLFGAAAFLNLNVEYSLTNWLSVGVNYKRGEMILFIPSDKNTFNSIGVQGRFYFVNKDKLALFGSANLASAFLKQQDTWDFPEMTETSKWKGVNAVIGVGVKYFWTEHIGMNVSMDYNFYNLKLKEETCTDPDYLDYPDEELFKEFKSAMGPELKLGIAYKF